MNWILAQTSQPAGFWMPQRASSVAGNVDGVFTFILWITIVFSLLVLALMVGFVVKYRYSPTREDAERAPAHSTALELTWTIVPTVIVLVVFYFGFRGYLNMAVSPPNAYEIVVTAKMWNWEFAYPNGHVSTSLHVPANTPIRLVLQSQDVIHSLFVPQFRVKRDVVPGRYNRLWFEATQLGKFDIYCAEYCGTSHSQMRTTAVVHELDGFKKWLETESNWETRLTPLKAGEQFVKTRGCMQCHSLDGSRLVGPSLKNVFGEERIFADGSRAVADENYIRESIFEPQARIVAGFPPQMPTYRATFKERDVGAIIEYLKSLSDKYKNQTVNLNATTTTAPQ